MSPGSALLVDPGALHAALGQLPDPGDTAFVLNSAVIGEVGPVEMYDPTGLLRAMFPSMDPAQRNQVLRVLGLEAATMLFGPNVNAIPTPGAAPAKAGVPWWAWAIALYLISKSL